VAHGRDVHIAKHKRRAFSVKAGLTVNSSCAPSTWRTHSTFPDFLFKIDVIPAHDTYCSIAPARRLRDPVRGVLWPEPLHDDAPSTW